MRYSRMQDLRNVFLETSEQARSGKSIVDRYAKKKKKGLPNLLRHYSEGTITDEETWLRDDVDYFLEYFSILSLGHITGYLSLEDLTEYKDEISYYLSLPPVHKYYYDHYPLELPQVLFEVVNFNRPFREKRKASYGSEALFHQFHSLNQTIDNDDVNQFLWFLDGGYVDGYDIGDLQKTLKDAKRCFEVQAQRKNNALRQSVRGFFIYLEFLQRLERFLASVSNKLDRSAYWMYHAYWFRKISRDLSLAISSFFSGIEKLLIDKNVLTVYPLLNRVKRGYYLTVENIVFSRQYSEFFIAYLKRWRVDKPKLATGAPRITTRGRQLSKRTKK